MEAFIVTTPSTQSGSPDQPPKTELASAAGASVTLVASPNGAEHFEPHVIPAGMLVTVPLPAPVFVTVSVRAVTLWARPFDVLDAWVASPL
jgi:hypothetical protein